MLLSTLHRSYQDGWFCGQRKPVHTVGQSPEFEPPTSAVRGQCAITVAPWSLSVDKGNEPLCGIPDNLKLIYVNKEKLQERLTFRKSFTFYKVVG